MHDNGFFPTLSRPVVAALLFGFLAGQPAWAGNKTSASKVKIKATPETGSDDVRVVKLHLTIDKDWYIYANPVGDEQLAPNATTVTLRNKIANTKITYPKGKFKKDGDFAYYYYTGDVTVTATVPNASGPLEFNVRVNACNVKGQCLSPGEIKLTVP
jgi:hypothetical protein